MCKLEFTPLSLSRQGDDFCIELSMLFSCESVGGDQSLSFTPVLSGGGHHLELPSVLVAGPGRYRAFKRAIGGPGKNILRPYRIGKIFKAINQNSICYTYKIHLKYEQWMSCACIRFV